MPVRLLALWLCAVCLLASGPAAPAAPAPAGGDDARLHATLQRVLDRYLSARSRPEHISALSLSISLPGRPDNLNLVAGRTSRAPSAPAVTPRSLFQIGSVTKSFTAALILQLEAEGKLSIGQTVGLWLPQYPAWKNVTIRQLLNMTSGIPTYDDQPTMLDAEAGTIRRRWTPAQLAAFVDPVYGHAPARKKRWYYSNTAYLLAGMIIERVTGTSFGEQIRRRFLGSRYGLEHTYYEPAVYPPSVMARLVSGYFFNPDPDVRHLKPLLGRDMKENDMSWTQAAGGIVSDSEDVTRWVRALYGGRVLRPRQLHEMMSLVSNKTGKPLARTSAPDPRGFGLGIAQLTLSPVGTFWFYQGETLGYRMVYFFLPQSDAVVAVGLNSQPSSKEDHVGQLLTSVYSALRQAGVIRANQAAAGPAHSSVDRR